MLKKHYGISVPENAPFENDKLARRIIIENFTKLISNLNQPFVLSINSQWGTGKTTFIKMWEQYLRNENYATLYFNAWENDFSNEPLISLIGELKGQLSKNNYKNNKEFKKYSNKIVKIGSKIVKQSIPPLLKVITKGILDLEAIKKEDDSDEKFDIGEGIGEALSKIAEDQIKDYSSNIDVRKKFKDNLNKFSEFVIGKEKKKKPIVFFIDELDRCRPDYAVKLMENIKHLFNIDNFVFVLAIDRKQIGYSIQTLYGKDMDTEGYLKRFIDLNYNLPGPSRNKYIEFMYNEYAFAKLGVNSNMPVEFKGIFQKVFTSFSDLLELSLREIEQCFTYLGVLFKILKPIDITSLYLVSFLIPLRIKKMDLCNDYISKKIDATALINKMIKDSKKGLDFFNDIDTKIEKIDYTPLYGANIGINLEFFLETAQFSNNYEEEKQYRIEINQKAGDENTDGEKEDKGNDKNRDKYKIKKHLVRYHHLLEKRDALNSIKSAFDFALHFDK